MNSPYSSDTGSSGLGVGRNVLLYGIIGVLILAFAIMGLSSYNYAVAQESAIQANRDSAKNVLGQYGPMLKEALGVTRLQAKDVANVITASNDSRYGEGGSKATVQWSQEQNPNLDQSNYGRIINLIEAGRRDFREAQNQQIDRVRSYRTGSQQFPRVIFLPMFGKPSPGFFEKYDKIIVSSQADEAYKTGIDDGVDVANMQ